MAEIDPKTVARAKELADALRVRLVQVAKLMDDAHKEGFVVDFSISKKEGQDSFRLNVLEISRKVNLLG